MGFEQQQCDDLNIYPIETFAFINIFWCQILLPTIPISEILFAHLALKSAGQEWKCKSLLLSRHAIYILTDHFICLEISNNVDTHHHWNFFVVIGLVKLDHIFIYYNNGIWNGFYFWFANRGNNLRQNNIN